MIIYYTFDYFPKYSEHYYSLKLSILSVIRELKTHIKMGTIKVYVYTTTYDFLVKELSIYLPYISIIKYDHSIFGQPLTQVTDIDVCKMHNLIGHSRVFISEYLLLNDVHDILYLDDDTGITLGCGEQFLKVVKLSQIPILWGLDIGNINSILSIHELKYNKFTNDTIEYDNKLYNLTNTILNNGIEYYPINTYSKFICKERRLLYIHLNKINPTFLNDMFSISLVMYRNGIENSFFYNRNKILISNYVVTHYHHEKVKLRMKCLNSVKTACTILEQILLDIKPSIILCDTEQKIMDLNIHAKYDITYIDIYGLKCPTHYIIYIPIKYVPHYVMFNNIK